MHSKRSCSEAESQYKKWHKGRNAGDTKKAKNSKYVIVKSK